MTKTLKVAGHKFNLTCGHRYLATRPFATARRNEKFTVAIIDISNGFTFNATPVARVPGLSYEEANRLLDAFNNGASSFEGRLVETDPESETWRN